uniref:plasmalemma vesicle associated protein b n=1 Tax=Pristiophorus japonicus TaxID=55135 RepID=UPI00398EBF0F
MDHNSYPMKKLGYNSRDYERTKSKSCSSYVQYFLLSTSVIQLLIIMGLVLFMTYGNNHSRQQSRLESTQNQSVKFISEIKQLLSIVGAQRRELRLCQYRSGNLSLHLGKVNKTLQSYIAQKNASPNTTNLLKSLQPFFSFNARDPSQRRQFEMVRPFETLQTNYSIVQKRLADTAAENELKEAKHMLEETKLNSQKRALSKQLEELRGNCTSISRDFQKMMDATRADYEAGFRPLTERFGHYDLDVRRRLEQIRANCTPLAFNFQRAVQQKLDDLDLTIREMWHSKNEQSSRIGTLEKMNEECKQEAAAQLNQFKTTESAMQVHEEKFLAEKVNLLEERNKLRSQLAATIRQPESAACHSRTDAARTILFLEDKNKILQGHQVELERQLATLKTQLEQQIAGYFSLIEEQKRLGCRTMG